MTGEKFYWFSLKPLFFKVLLSFSWQLKTLRANSYSIWKFTLKLTYDCFYRPTVISSNTHLITNWFLIISANFKHWYSTDNNKKSLSIRIQVSISPIASSQQIVLKKQIHYIFFCFLVIIIFFIFCKKNQTDIIISSSRFQKISQSPFLFDKSRIPLKIMNKLISLICISGWQT